MDGSEQLRAQALAAVEELLAQLPRGTGDSDRKHVAVMAWLEGYGAGHTDATKHAVEVINR